MFTMLHFLLELFLQNVFTQCWTENGHISWTDGQTQSLGTCKRLTALSSYPLQHHLWLCSDSNQHPKGPGNDRKGQISLDIAGDFRWTYARKPMR